VKLKKCTKSRGVRAFTQFFIFISVKSSSSFQITHNVNKKQTDYQNRMETIGMRGEPTRTLLCADEKLKNGDFSIKMKKYSGKLIF